MSRDVEGAEKTAPPEEPMVSPPLRRRLQQIHAHVQKLFEQEKYDFDYAHSMLVECVVQDPGNLGFLESLLQNLDRKYNHNKRGARLKGFSGRGPFKKAVANKDWNEVLLLGPDLLKTNPWDTYLLRSLAKACAGCHHSSAELRYLKNALDAKPHDAELNRHCARSLGRVGKYDQAIACWHRVDELKRGDREAQEMMSELQIEKTRAMSGKGEDPKRSRVPRPTPGVKDSWKSPSEEEPRRREIQLTPRQILEQKLVNNPADREAAFDLADLHVNEQRLPDATHVLKKAFVATGEDIAIQERLEDIDILRKKQEVEAAEHQATRSSDPAAKKKTKQLRTQLNHHELDVFERRSQRHPEDLELKFQLGLRFRRLHRYDEAMACLRESQELPERRAISLLEMGECWQRQKQYDKALQRYQQAADIANEENHVFRKVALNRAAVLASGLGNLDSAQKCLEELVLLDPNYKDAAARLDKIREMRHSE